MTLGELGLVPNSNSDDKLGFTSSPCVDSASETALRSLSDR